MGLCGAKRALCGAFSREQYVDAEQSKPTGYIEVCLLPPPPSLSRLELISDLMATKTIHPCSVIDSGVASGEVPRGEKMLQSGTDPESHITEHTSYITEHTLYITEYTSYINEFAFVNEDTVNLRGIRQLWWGDPVLQKSRQSSCFPLYNPVIQKLAGEVIDLFFVY